MCGVLHGDLYSACTRTKYELHVTDKPLVIDGS